MKPVAWVVGFVLLLVASGCTTYERVIESDSLFDRLERSGATSPGAGRSVVSTRPDGAAARQVDIAPAREVLEDESVVLRTRNPRELIRHAYETLRDEEPDLFVKFVLSDATAAAFYERGMEPEAAYDRLRARFTDIRALLSRIPEGELSPASSFSQLGPNRFRLRAVGRARADLVWTNVDMIVEDGSWRLLWFGAR